MNDRNRSGGSRSQTRDRQSSREGQPNHPAPATPSAPVIAVDKILEGSPEDLDAGAHQIAQSCKGLSRSQMRNFFGPIVRLRAELANPSFDPRRCARNLYMHSARVTYMAARDDDAASLEHSFKSLVQKAVLNSAIESVKLRSICDFAEAIVAYHYPLAR
jgi:CRISPR type III-A-associated protein Csm2